MSPFVEVRGLGGSTAAKTEYLRQNFDRLRFGRSRYENPEHIPVYPDQIKRAVNHIFWGAETCLALCECSKEIHKTYPFILVGYSEDDCKEAIAEFQEKIAGVGLRHSWTGKESRGYWTEDRQYMMKRYHGRVYVTDCDFRKKHEEFHKVKKISFIPLLGLADGPPDNSFIGLELLVMAVMRANLDHINNCDPF